MIRRLLIGFSSSVTRALLLLLMVTSLFAYRATTEASPFNDLRNCLIACDETCLLLEAMFPYWIDYLDCTLDCGDDCCAQYGGPPSVCSPLAP